MGFDSGDRPSLILPGKLHVSDLADGSLDCAAVCPARFGFAIELILHLLALLAAVPRCAVLRAGLPLAPIGLGHGTGAERSAVALNAGALLATAGKAEDLKQGVEMALATLGSGGALTTLNGLVEITNG